MRRALAIALFAVLFAVPGAARADAPRPLDGTWEITFKPTVVHAVGIRIGRHNEPTCEGACESQYQFPEGIGHGETLQFQLFLDASTCHAVPCDIGARTGRTALPPIRFDGTTYTSAGGRLFSQFYCDGKFDGPTDTLTFTAAGPDTIAGIASLVLGATGPTSADKCLRVNGYELYDGTFSGTLLNFGGRPGASTPSAGTAGSLLPKAPLTAAGTAAVVADRVAAHAHARPVLSTGIADARELPWSPSRLLTSALLALLLVALLRFPAAVFNATLEHNYATVRGWFPFLRDRPEGDDGAAKHPRRALLVLVVAAALLNAFLDPRLRFDRASAILVAGLALSILAVSLLAAVPARTYVRRRYAERALVRLYPIGLGVAAVCVLVSRLTSFEPGYLYGVVAGFAFRRELAREEKGRVHAATAAFLLVVAAAAFALRVPVHAAALHSNAVPLALLDTVLAAVFAAGVEGNVLGLLPLRFLPGEELLGWSRLAWSATFGVSVFAFLHALAARAGDASPGTSLAVAAALFGGFGAVSVTFWADFRWRPGDPTPASV